MRDDSFLFFLSLVVHVPITDQGRATALRQQSKIGKFSWHGLGTTDNFIFPLGNTFATRDGTKQFHPFVVLVRIFAVTKILPILLVGHFSKTRTSFARPVEAITCAIRFTG